MSWSFPRLLVVLGWVASVVAVLAVSGFSFASLLDPQVGPFLIPGLVGAAILAWRERFWTYLVAGVTIALVPVLFAAFGILGALANPTSFPEFAASLLVLASGALVLPAAIVGALRTRRHRALPGARAGWVSRPGLALAGVLLALAGAGATSALASWHAHAGASAGGAYDVAPQERATIVAQGNVFSPDVVTVHRGALTEIAIENRDAVLHTFTYDAAGAASERSHDVLGSGTTRVLVEFDQPGDVPYRCVIHPGMTGTLRVT